MEAKIIQIGNAKGIILNKAILDKYGFEEIVNLRMEEHFLIIEPVKKPRENWDEAFIKMHLYNDDQLLMSDVFEDEIDLY
ncbi:MAG: AbrB/MazE/SpoVT family DNA-binding domain-containing protein [Saprospiraceae bacterium]|nr:AbrB/MazE/SpoVT family DNA-binding domain-containing protein [Saprospiraceae bacterium]